MKTYIARSCGVLTLDDHISEFVLVPEIQPLPEGGKLSFEGEFVLTSATELIGNIARALVGDMIDKLLAQIDEEGCHWLMAALMEEEMGS